MVFHSIRKTETAILCVFVSRRVVFRYKWSFIIFPSVESSRIDFLLLAFRDFWVGMRISNETGSSILFGVEVPAILSSQAHYAIYSLFKDCRFDIWHFSPHCLRFYRIWLPSPFDVEFKRRRPPARRGRARLHPQKQTRHSAISTIDLCCLLVN